MRYSKTCSST